MGGATIEATVIVPCFEAEGVVGRCLESLSAQTAPFPYEIIVLDNGSTDRTGEIAEQAAAASEGRIRVLREDKPGAYAARNHGIREARGRCLLFIDSDCRAEPTWVEALVRELGDPSAPLLVGGEVVGEPAQGGLVARYSRRVETLSQAHTLRHPHCPFLQTASLGVRAEDARAIGGFDESLFSGGDADFCWRMRAARGGGPLRLVPGANVYHFHRETLRALYRQYRRYGQGDVLLARKHGATLVRTLAKIVVDILRIVLAIPVSLLSLPLALVRRDVLPVMSPLLRAVRVIARRTGQLRALLAPRTIHRA